MLLHVLLDTPPSWERSPDTAEWMRRTEPFSLVKVIWRVCTFRLADKLALMARAPP